MGEHDDSKDSSLGGMWNQAVVEMLTRRPLADLDMTPEPDMLKVLLKIYAWTESKALVSNDPEKVEQEIKEKIDEESWEHIQSLFNGVFDTDYFEDPGCFPQKRDAAYDRHFANMGVDSLLVFEAAADPTPERFEGHIKEYHDIIEGYRRQDRESRELHKGLTSMEFIDMLTAEKRAAAEAAAEHGSPEHRKRIEELINEGFEGFMIEQMTTHDEEEPSNLVDAMAQSMKNTALELIIGTVVRQYQNCAVDHTHMDLLRQLHISDHLEVELNGVVRLIGPKAFAEAFSAELRNIRLQKDYLIGIALNTGVEDIFSRQSYYASISGSFGNNREKFIEHRRLMSAIAIGMQLRSQLEQIKGMQEMMLGIAAPKDVMMNELKSSQGYRQMVENYEKQMMDSAAKIFL